MTKKHGSPNKKPLAKALDEHATECERLAYLRKNAPSSIVRRYNVFHPVCSLLFGKHHKASHRMVVGFIVAAGGVYLAKYTGHFESELVHYLGDGVGYGLHGMGLVPFIEYITEAVESSV